MRKDGCKRFAICMDCQRDWRSPPYLDFGLPIHIRQHIRKHPEHVVVFWCKRHLEAEERITLEGDRELVREPLLSRNGLCPHCGQPLP